MSLVKHDHPWFFHSWRRGFSNVLGCEKYPGEISVFFSTNQDPSKSIYLCTWPEEVVLNHQKLPWVRQVDPLIIHDSGSQDVRKARGSYIGSSAKLLEIFYFCKSYLLCKLVVLCFLESIFGTVLASMPANLLILEHYS